MESKCKSKPTVPRMNLRDLVEISSAFTSDHLQDVVHQIIRFEEMLARVGPIQRAQLQLAAQLAVAELRGLMSAIEAMSAPSVAEQVKTEGGQA